MRFYLFNCFEQKIGNKNGYATFRGAAQAERLRRNEIYAAYDKMKINNPDNRKLSRISQGE